MIRIKTKIVGVVLTVAIAAACCILCVSCDNGNNGGDQNGGNFGNYVTVTGIVRTASFAPLQESIFYDGDFKCASDEQGRFEISIPRGSDEDYTTMIGISSDSFRYVQYGGQMNVVIIKLEEGMQISDFYFLSGKVVLQSDGETVAAGASLRIDDNTVKTFETDRNFDLEPVYKNSVVSAYKEGCEFVDANMIPYNEICFADALATASETRTITVNGKTEELKFISGVTFRLNDIQ